VTRAAQGSAPVEYATGARERYLMSADLNTWAAVCEAVNELDEPPIRRCPQCSHLCYEVPRGTYHCPACMLGELKPVAS
jgi:hypothetical protein